jgi:hypothetical protein
MNNYDTLLETSSVLTIVVNQHWFDKIANREKREDFRELKPYWNSRLVYPQFQFLSSKNLYFPLVLKYNPRSETRNYNSPHQLMGMAVKIDFKEYDLVKMVVGYKKDRDTLVSKFKGVRITSSKEKTDLGIGSFFAVDVSEILYVNGELQENVKA